MLTVALPVSRLWLLFLLLFSASFVDVGALNEEASVLLTFKQFIREDPDGVLSNWNSSDPSPCSWDGITCRNDRVISISVPKKKLLGSLSPVLGSLSSLRHVNLRNNRLYGSLPPGLFNVSGLQSLVLYGNSLSGTLPSLIGNLLYLQILDVSHNLLNGSVPLSLLNCKRLKALDISHNNFTGSLPDEFENSFVSLEKLDLSYNQFNGSLPGDIGNLSNLQGTLDFSNNLFSGSIPASLGNLSEKVYIDLSYNNLSGSIPQSGALAIRGPTVFVGNPGLCGPPLKNPCSADVSASNPSSFPYPSFNYTPAGSANISISGYGSRKSFSTGAVIAIITSDIFGICIIALCFFLCYRRTTSYRGSKECTCFRREKTVDQLEGSEQLDLIPLDKEINFDLDELLKASAFVLGKSDTGFVYRVLLEDGLNLAVRRLGEGGSKRFKEFQAEVEAIARVRHANIVALRAYYWSFEEKLLVYEYIPNGNLSDAVHGKAGTVEASPLTWAMRLKIIKGVAKGLSYLHEFSPKKYIHGELKPNNILLGLNMEPYISDFGLRRLANIAGETQLLQSERVTSEKPQIHSVHVAGSPAMGTAFCYQAPEAFKNLKPSQKWDVYSYGVILLELLTGKPPIFRMGSADMDLVKWIHQICIVEKKSLDEVLDLYLLEEPETEDQIICVLHVALACVQTDPDRRPSMRHILETLDGLSI